MRTKKSALREDRVKPALATPAESRRQAKLERLRQALIEGEKSGRAKDSSIESIIAELDRKR